MRIHTKLTAMKLAFSLDWQSPKYIHIYIDPSLIDQILGVIILIIDNFTGYSKYHMLNDELAHYYCTRCISAQGTDSFRTNTIS